ncbi:protein-tyrosine phosphatase/ribose 5-phosphate isomerase B [Haloferula luteola]|uniref:protein-tyrosine-phosphatase n=1 Tax=Haloferula luteola TaxID=595692 RepID=A0A840V8G6_9BACT|nr:low molecular weight protein arginine phosphatase [Haloferula luteola]MBB5353346.1 protein-tyrosine phosphatase/ribose 5-phosphate isomerase B [Haloferula luteola]
MSATHKVLFVCTGNTCRSPMAEALFRDAVEDREEFEVASAGVAAYPGSPISGESAAILMERGIESGAFRSQPVTEELLDWATHVFAMTGGHLAALLAEWPEYEDKFYLMCEFVELPGRGIGADVPDPIGMGKRAYEQVAGTFDRAIPTLIALIDQTS